MKEKLDKLIFKNTLIFFIYIFIIDLIFRFNTGVIFFEWSMLRITLGGVILSILISLVITSYNKWWQNITATCIALLILIYSWLQLNLYNYLGFFYGIDNAGQGMKVTDYFMEMIRLSRWSSYLMIIPCLILILYYWYIKQKLKQKWLEKTIYFEFYLQRGKDSLLSYLIIFLVIVCLGISYYGTLIFNVMQNDLQPVRNTELFIVPDNTNLAVAQFGILTFGITDLISNIFNIQLDIDLNDIKDSNQLWVDPNLKRIIDDSAWQALINYETNDSYNNINRFLINQPITPKNEMTGIFEGKNLIVILMESVNEMFINIEYFPTFYHLYNNGISFRNNYSPRNSCATGNNEITLMTSLHTIKNTCVAHRYLDNTYFHSIFNQFNKVGYHTSSYHNFIEFYYFRRGIHANMGSGFYKNAIDLDINWSPAHAEWPSDIELAKKALPHFINEERFMAFLITVSAHGPYSVPSYLGDKHLNLFSEDYPISVRRYLSKLKELDLALALLLEELELHGILEDTVIALFSDHHPHGLRISDIKASTLLSYDITINREIDRTPMVIYNSEIEPMVVESYTALIDLLPTLLNLFNKDHDPRLYFGNDIFSNEEGRVIFADGSWQSANGFFNGTTNQFIHLNDHYYTKAQITLINRHINKVHRMSSRIIRNNYFAYLEAGLRRHS